MSGITEDLVKALSEAIDLRVGPFAPRQGCGPNFGRNFRGNDASDAHGAKNVARQREKIVGFT